MSSITRSDVVAEATTWVGTPYHHRGQVRGVGVDCATLLSCVYSTVGLIPAVELPNYSPQWHINRHEERYTDFIRQFAREISAHPLPGDVVVWRFHNAYAHGGIVVDWPVVIHAFVDVGCVFDDAEANAQLRTVNERTEFFGQDRPLKFFSVFGD